MSVPVMSDGIRSGVNWIRRNGQVHRLPERADEQRLGQPGHALHQAVPAGEDRDQDLLHHPLLPTITFDSSCWSWW
jgi:hypothetical protein